jgi:hypothetical protein
MRPPGSSPTRRALLGAALGAAVARRAARAETPVTDPMAGENEATAPAGDAGRGARLLAASVIVGGPPDGEAGSLAHLLAPLLGPALLGSAPLGVQPTGGIDGVTAANAFETRASPDGSTALMVPGTASLAWLAGDPRVHFDAGLWVPALAATAPVVLVGRRAPRPGEPFRLAGAGPVGREMPALLALELLHASVEPRFDIRLAAEAEAAVREGAADAIVIGGRDVPARLAALAAGGIAPIFALGGLPDALGQPARDPAIAHVETFDAYAERVGGARPAGPLLPGYRAAAAAARLDTALVLPQLASAGIVALWRAACDEAADTPELRDMSAREAVMPLSAPGCVAAVAATVAGETAQLDLHRFLAERYGWHPA